MTVQEKVLKFANWTIDNPEPEYVKTLETTIATLNKPEDAAIRDFLCDWRDDIIDSLKKGA